MATIFFDLETNGLFDRDDLTIHCMSWAVDDRPVKRAVGLEAVRAVIKDIWCAHPFLKDATLVAHNLMGFDLPVLERLFDFNSKALGFSCADTKVIGSVVDPEFSGGHSLEDWGRRVGAPKDDYQERCKLAGIDPWAAYSEEMGTYCDQDVETLRKVHKHQHKHYLDSGHNWKLALSTEHVIAYIMAEQGRTGVWFNMQQAVAVKLQMTEWVAERTARLQSLIKPKCMPGEAVAKPFKKDGKPSANAVKALGYETEEACGAAGVTIVGDFDRVAFSEYDLDSRPQVVQLLQQHGWKPTEYTEKGNPKFTEDSITAQLGGVGKDLAERFVAITRMGQLQGWVDKVRADGRIEAKAFANATPTARMRHSVLVNVPRPGTAWGPEMRRLFGAAPGLWQCGADASGLELRMLAHYIGDPEFTRQVCEGDIHWYICQLIGLVPMGTVRNKDTHTEEGKLHEAIRTVEKTYVYGLVYGAGDTKLGSILSDLPGPLGSQYGNEDGGALTRQRLMAQLPGYGNLVKAIEAELKANKSWLLGLDGRKLYVRSEHAALNTLLQSAGSIVVKLATIYAWQAIREKRIAARQVLHMHDEAQYEGLTKADALAAGEAFVAGVTKAGLFYKVRAPLTGECKVGRHWAACH